MEFRPTDHASERQLKLDVIAVYNHRLDEREKRKRFVLEHNLLDYKKQQQNNNAGRKRHKVILQECLADGCCVRSCCFSNGCGCVCVREMCCL